MRRGFTLLELAVTTVICAVIAVLVTTAAVALKEESKNYIHQGEDATVIKTGMRVTVVGYIKDMLLCRIDNGEGSNPRFQELHFARVELQKIQKVEK